MNPPVLADLSWPELEGIRGSIGLVLIPVGATEQHGPNIAYQSDIALATAVAMELARRQAPRVLVAPGVPWGVSPHHMAFAGTLSLEADTLVLILRDLVRSLARHGFRKILIINGHGGNDPALGVAVQRIYTECDVDFVGACSYFRLIDTRPFQEQITSVYTGHACELEVSWALALRPDIVKSGQLAPGQLQTDALAFRQTLLDSRVVAGWTMDEMTINGAFGDATHATAALGQQMLEPMFQRVSRTISTILDYTPPAAPASRRTGDRAQRS